MLPPRLPTAARQLPATVRAPPPSVRLTKLSRDEVKVDSLTMSYLYELPPSEGQAPDEEPLRYTFFLVHGAGQSAATFTLLAEVLARHGYAVFCPDQRGHGQTWRGIDEDAQLHIDLLIGDLRGFVEKILIKYNLKESEIFLVGHSMGGAVVAKTAPQLSDVRIYGVALLDVCEELATAALMASRDFARRIPHTFPSEAAAVDWATGHIISNRESAELSIPGQLTLNDTGAPNSVRWKVPLLRTEKFWSEWFRGMNSAFLSGPWANRILITSGIHAVDSELAIAQMKGKIQIEVLAKCGHIVHEDQTDAVADILLFAIGRQEKLRQILSGRKNKKE